MNDPQRPCAELWPKRRKFERTLTISDGEGYAAARRRGRVGSGSFDSESDTADEEVECGRECSDYYEASPIVAPCFRSKCCGVVEKRKTEEEDFDDSYDDDDELSDSEENEGHAALVQLGQTCKVIFIMFLPIFARQAGVLLSRTGKLEDLFINVSVLSRWFGRINV